MSEWFRVATSDRYGKYVFAIFGAAAALNSETLVAQFTNHYTNEVCHISRDLDAIFITKIPNFH